MRREVIQKIEIPEGIEVSLEENKVKVKGTEGELEREFNFTKMDVKKENNEIVIVNKKATKSEKKRINTTASHIKNMIKGVNEGHIYKLKICSSHFPMNVSINNDELVVKNFFGEKSPRTLKIKSGVTTKVEGSEIIIESTNKELAGQAAADIEQLTRITNKDRRIFQDGIYITEKDGKKIE